MLTIHLTSPNVGNYSPYELVFGRKPKSLLNQESTPDIKVSRAFKEYFELLNRRLKYLHRLLLDFKSERLVMINENRDFFQHNNGDLVYIISPLMSQLCTASRKVIIKYVGPVVIYKLIDPHSYQLMTLDGKILKGLLEHERLKPANIRKKSKKCSKLHAFKTSYECGIQDLRNLK